MTTRKQIMTTLKAQLEQLKDLQRDTFYYQDTIDGMDSDKFLQEQIDTLRLALEKL